MTLAFRAVGISLLALMLSIGGLFAWIILRAQADWNAICRGGQDNRFFHSAECKDISTLLLILTPITAITLLISILILYFWSRKRLRAQAPGQN